MLSLDSHLVGVGRARDLCISEQLSGDAEADAGPGLGCEWQGPDALGLQTKALREATCLMGLLMTTEMGNEQSIASHCTKEPAVGHGVSPDEGEEKETAAKPEVTRSYYGRKPAGRRKAAFNRRAQRAFVRKYEVPLRRWIYCWLNKITLKKSTLRKMIIRLMPPSKTVSGSRARGL